MNLAVKKKGQTLFIEMKAVDFNCVHEVKKLKSSVESFSRYFDHTSVHALKAIDYYKSSFIALEEAKRRSGPHFYLINYTDRDGDFENGPDADGEKNEHYHFAGFVSLVFFPEQCEIKSVFIEEKMRRKGVGRNLVKAVDAEYRRNRMRQGSDNALFSECLYALSGDGEQLSLQSAQRFWEFVSQDGLKPAFVTSILLTNWEKLLSSVDFISWCKTAEEALRCPCSHDGETGCFLCEFEDSSLQYDLGFIENIETLKLKLGFLAHYSKLEKYKACRYFSFVLTRDLAISIPDFIKPYLGAHPCYLCRLS